MRTPASLISGAEHSTQSRKTAHAKVLKQEHAAGGRWLREKRVGDDAGDVTLGSDHGDSGAIARTWVFLSRAGIDFEEFLSKERLLYVNRFI